MAVAGRDKRTSIHPALALHAMLLRHLAEKGILSAEELGHVLNGAIELAADHPEADAIRAIFPDAPPQD